MGGGRGTTVNYQPPNIPKDDTFANYLKYQQERERKLEERAETEKAEQKAAAEARKASAASAYGGMKSGIESQLRQGLISYGDATSQLRDYAAKYDLAPPEADVSALTDVYTKELLPGRRKTGITSSYEEMYGRPATEEEVGKATERFQQGYYGTVQDLRDSLAKSPEYQKKFNQSYLDNYYDTQFGKQLTDAAGERTGKRTFTFDKSLLPTYVTATKARAGVEVPTFQDQFIGTPAEIDEQLQNVRDTRKYLYSAGLTNLQGEIDSQIQKLKNESAQDIARTSAFGNVASSLVSGFWS